MSLIVLASASGSPGVTTAGLGLALGWPRPALLVEADPTGGSAVAAGYLRGSVVPPEAMIELALAQHVDEILETLPRVSMELPGSAARWVPGTRSHEQARSLVPLWEPLTAALRSLDATGQDVIVDAGRLGLFGSPDPVLLGADLALLVTRTDMVSLSGARSWAETLRDRFARAGASSTLGVVLVGEGRPFRAREVASVLQLPVVTTLAWDPDSAEVLSNGAEPARAGLLQRLAGRSGWEDSPLLRSLRGRAARSRAGSGSMTSSCRLQVGGRRHDERTVAAQWRLWRSGVVTSAVHDPFAEAGSGPWHVLASGGRAASAGTAGAGPAPPRGRSPVTVCRSAGRAAGHRLGAGRRVPHPGRQSPGLGYGGGVARPRGLRPRPGRGRADPDGSVRAGAVRLVGDRGPSA